jgi:hypothetical protein
MLLAIVNSCYWWIPCNLLLLLEDLQGKPENRKTDVSNGIRTGGPARATLTRTSRQPMTTSWPRAFLPIGALCIWWRHMWRYWTWFIYVYICLYTSYIYIFNYVNIYLKLLVNHYFSYNMVFLFGFMVCIDGLWPYFEILSYKTQFLPTWVQ